MWCNQWGFSNICLCDVIDDATCFRSITWRKSVDEVCQRRLCGTMNQSKDKNVYPMRCIIMSISVPDSVCPLQLCLSWCYGSSSLHLFSNFLAMPLWTLPWSVSQLPLCSCPMPEILEGSQLLSRIIQVCRLITWSQKVWWEDCHVDAGWEMIFHRDPGSYIERQKN